MTTPEVVFILIATVWAGTIVGVSFIATPAKFRAASLTIPIALDVGRTTFRVSLAVELLFGIGLIMAASMAFGLSRETVAAAVIFALCAAQRAILLPMLSDAGYRRGAATSLLASRRVDRARRTSPVALVGAEHRYAGTVTHAATLARARVGISKKGYGAPGPPPVAR
ncbi:MAG: hypothetical protein M3R64_02735 [Pseudomonadota bacterium]|nr:hypothetical protein [Pseudomonadota bacterium]